jgi:hypothetical protein
MSLDLLLPHFGEDWNVEVSSKDKKTLKPQACMKLSPGFEKRVVAAAAK